MFLLKLLALVGYIDVDRFVDHKYRQYMCAANTDADFCSWMRICRNLLLLGPHQQAVGLSAVTWVCVRQMKDPDPDFQLSGNQGQKVHHYFKS